MAKRRKPARAATSRSSVTRAEFAAVLRLLDQRAELIRNLQRTCNIQFERIAQMQVQIDHLERRMTSRGRD